MGRRIVDQFADESPATKEPSTVGTVTRLRPPKGLSMTPNAVRKRAAREARRVLEKATEKAAKKAARQPPGSPLPAAAQAATQPPPGPPRAASQPQAQPASGPHAADHGHDAAHVVMLAGLTIASALVVAGTYLVLWGVVGQLYPGIPGALRAALPLCVEMLAGALVHWCVTHRGTVSSWLRVPLAVVPLVVIWGCVKAELVAADAVPAAAARARVDHALSAKGEDCKLELPQKDEKAGPEARLQYAKAVTAAYAGQAACRAGAQQVKAQATSNARAVAPGEEDLPRLLALLGAVGSSAFLPLLVAFIRAARKGGARGDPVRSLSAT